MLSGKNVLGNSKVDILQFLHCLGIGNNHRVVLWSGLLFCLWLFPLSSLCGDVVITSRAQHSLPTFMLGIKYNADTRLLSEVSQLGLLYCILTLNRSNRFSSELN